MVVFFFTDHNIALIDLSKHLPIFFTAQTTLIKMFRILFLRSDLSDQSDFARSKATERLDKPAQFCLFTFSLLIFPNLCRRFHALKDFSRRFNRNNFSLADHNHSLFVSIYQTQGTT